MAAERSPFLRNSYWVLRHGKSIPNEKGLIVSSLENGVLPEFGLGSEGLNQAKLAGELFSKATVEFRERYFGPTFELLSHEKYAEIWALDEKDPFMPPEGGESVANVASRLATAVANIEAEFEGCVILVVSHGDPLQILQTILNAAKKQETSQESDMSSRIKSIMVHSVLSQHRKFALETAELRQIK
ncbi:uncharacterized protein LOC109821092 isoform X2 [Asparagus officinalis]|uniref:uncharacterized protein LOC109821092 isoform X2 n=1 Tax=Asparagus officinalis TaxID=4686 RepID=UPI00098E5C2C|nr:uncharacterized protein LOC109821092 isoform X2 [Asparagus officinalis]